MAIWFYEVPKMGGGWAPQVKVGDMPTSKGSEGKLYSFMQAPIEVTAEELKTLGLSGLQMLYGIDANTDSMERLLEELAEEEDPSVQLDEEFEAQKETPPPSYADIGIQNLQMAFKFLPQSQEKTMAAMFLDTAMLWFNYASNKANQAQFIRHKD